MKKLKEDWSQGVPATIHSRSFCLPHLLFKNIKITQNCNSASFVSGESWSRDQAMQEGRDFLNFNPPPFQEIKKSIIQYCPRWLQDRKLRYLLFSQILYSSQFSGILPDVSEWRKCMMNQGAFSQISAAFRRKILSHFWPVYCRKARHGLMQTRTSAIYAFRTVKYKHIYFLSDRFP